MSITITDALTMGNIYPASSVARSQNQRMSREEEKRDIMTLSDQAKDFQTIYKTLLATPDIREEKVLELQNRINVGTYDVSSSDLANKILEHV